VKRGLTWEQWLILAVSAAVLIPGAWWGLPNAHRIELLLAGKPLSPEEMRQITRERERSRGEYEDQREIRAQTFSRGEQTQLIEAVDRTGEVLTREERWRSFYDFVSRSSAVDEGKTYSALARMRPGELQFDPGLYIYGGSYLYPLGAILMILNRAGAFEVTRELEYLVRHPANMARVIVTGRYVNVVAFLATVVVLGRLGASLGGRAAGSVAMLSYAFSTVALNQAVVSKPHVYAAFFSLLSVYWIVRFVDDAGSRWLVLSAVAAGWSAGASLPSCLIAILYPVVLFRRGGVTKSIRQLAIVGLVMMIVFIASNPYALIRFNHYYFTLFSHGSGEGWGYGQLSFSKLWAFLSDVFTVGYCFPVSLLGAGALLEAWHRPDGMRGRLALVTMAILLATGMTVAVLRIMLFVGPLVCLFAGFGAALLIERTRRQWRLVAIGVLIALFLPGTVFAGLFARDTISSEAWYEPAREWIGALRTDEATTFGVQWLPHPVDTPPFPFVHSRAMNLSYYSGTQGKPDYVVLGNFTSDRSWWERHLLRSEYELLATLGGRASYDWALRWRVQSEARVVGFVYKRR
jgi:hypothetical protein